MRKTLVAVYVGSITIILGTHSMLPERVAIHFGVNGVADGWASPTGHSAIFLGMLTFFLILFLGIPRLILSLPDDLINMPNKGYWLDPARRSQAGRMLQDLLSEYGTVMIIMVTLMALISLNANLAAQVHLRMDLFLGVMGLFLGYTAWWCIRLTRRFKLPKP